MRCDRCGETSGAFTMSRFNTEMICLQCDEKERAHPEYERAREVEHAQVMAGNYNYPGIGKPEDL